MSAVTGVIDFCGRFRKPFFIHQAYFLHSPIAPGEHFLPSVYIAPVSFVPTILGENC